MSQHPSIAGNKKSGYRFTCPKCGLVREHAQVSVLKQFAEHHPIVCSGKSAAKGGAS